MTKKKKNTLRKTYPIATLQIPHKQPWKDKILSVRARAEPDATRAETTFRLSPKRDESI